jgi:hypothetical protein
MDIEGDMILLKGDPLRSMAGQMAQHMGISERQVIFAALDIYRTITRQGMTPAEMAMFDSGPTGRAARRAKWRRRSNP